MKKIWKLVELRINQFLAREGGPESIYKLSDALEKEYLPQLKVRQGLEFKARLRIALLNHALINEFPYRDIVELSRRAISMRLETILCLSYESGDKLRRKLKAAEALFSDMLVSYPELFKLIRPLRLKIIRDHTRRAARKGRET